jgi:hypothetical protein
MIKLNDKTITEKEFHAFIAALEPEKRKQVIRELVQAMAVHDKKSLTIILKELSIH